MALELKKKDVMNNYFVVRNGYCDAQSLFKFSDRIGYTHGVYGWNSDIYIFGNIAISTGYRPFGNTTKKCEDFINEYNKYAKSVIDNGDFTWDVKRKHITALLDKCLTEIRKEIMER